MNIISFVLSVIAAVLFAGTYRGLKWGSLGLGLCLLTIAWTLQLLWTTSQITL